MTISDEQFGTLVRVVLGEAEAHEESDVRQWEHASTEIAGTLASLRDLVGLMRAGELAPPPADITAAARRLFDQRPGPAFARAVQSVSAAIATLIYDSFAAPAPAGFRGQRTVRHLVLSSDAGEIDLRIEPGDGDERIILGQFDANKGAPPKLCLIEPLDGPSPSCRTTLSADGIFQARVAPGAYRLVFKFPDSDVTVERVDV